MLRAWSGITGWRFESSSAHQESPARRGFLRSGVGLFRSSTALRDRSPFRPRRSPRRRYWRSCSETLSCGSARGGFSGCGSRHVSGPTRRSLGVGRLSPPSCSWRGGHRLGLGERPAGGRSDHLRLQRADDPDAGHQRGRGLDAARRSGRRHLGSLRSGLRVHGARRLAGAPARVRRTRPARLSSGHRRPGPGHPCLGRGPPPQPGDSVASPLGRLALRLRPPGRATG